MNPSIKQMLIVGDSCGLRTVEEAYNNYTNHYDLFFSIENFHAQHGVLVEELLQQGYIQKSGHGEWDFLPILIEDCECIKSLPKP